jgi:hypothetical protein
MTEAKENDAADKPATDDGKRDRSTIEFPYMDLDTAVAVANGINARVGGGTCQHDELAVQLGLSPNSSGYRTRLSTARMFGLITSQNGDGVRLTDLGAKVIDSSHARQARTAAFLSVPLFKRVYDAYRGRVLPPAAALQREMIGMGVAPKQAERVRQIMERCAESAGFFESGRERLVMPAGVNSGTLAPKAPEPDRHSETADQHTNHTGGSGNGGGDRGGGGRHPFIEGLLRTLPEPETNWAVEGRAKWLQAAANIFDLIYKGDGDITVKAASKSE